ncbi:MAG: gamma-glutamylcyclotransferase family protein, partial [Syntrophomonas sp.]
MVKVFVYGGLMTKGRYHQHYLQGKTFLGKGFINGYKEYILGGLRAAYPEEGERIQGEVYEVDQTALAKLDFLHTNCTHFTRRIVDVEMENGET